MTPDTLDDGEFWLPPRFLSDDDDEDYDKAAFGCFSSSSDFSSPLESESDEDDFLAGLTRQLAHSNLQANNKPKVVVSPQSTLSPVYGGTPANGQTQDLLFAAAGQVSRMMGGPPPYHAVNNPDFGVFSNQQKIHAFKFEQMMRQKLWAAKVNAERLMAARVSALEASAWPSLQQAKQLQQGNNKGAVFLGGNRQSAGTGFFMPRRAVAPVEHRVKPGYPNVFVPEKVAYALQESRLNGGGDAVHSSGNGNFRLRQQGPRAQQKQQTVVNNPEVQLPQEWTY